MADPILRMIQRANAAPPAEQGKRYGVIVAIAVMVALVGLAAIMLGLAIAASLFAG